MTRPGWTDFRWWRSFFRFERTTVSIADSRGLVRPVHPLLNVKARFFYVHPIPGRLFASIVSTVQSQTVGLGSAVATPIGIAACIGAARLWNFGSGFVWALAMIAVGVLAYAVVWGLLRPWAIVRYPKVHVRILLAAEYCPWCTRSLAGLSVDASGSRTCDSCGGTWKGRIGGFRGHVAGVTSIGIALITGLTGVLPASMLLMARSAAWAWGATGFVAVSLGVAAYLWARFREVRPWILAAPFVGWAAFGVWRMRGPGTDGLEVVVASLLQGCAVWVGARLGGQPRASDHREGVGTSCAGCGYDLRRFPSSMTCPECGAHLRVNE
ncbi:hypothetical protein PHYC_00023 [Phycisphaerales bacterium]|nr:hypothetical protein PHYC_00023 [Phycisphaerales bacterium]